MVRDRKTTYIPNTDHGPVESLRRGRTWMFDAAYPSNGESGGVPGANLVWKLLLSWLVVHSCGVHEGLLSPLLCFFDSFGF